MARCIINLATRRGDVFHRKYLNSKNDEIKKDIPCEESDFEIRKIKEQDEIRMLNKISNIEENTGSCYYRLMIAAIHKHGSMREVSRKTGIPVKSISNAMRKIRKILTND